jgi:spore coat polysaccharide biosynthesis protein SpsF
VIFGVLQARLSSSRLPGKVLKQILDRPMLEMQIERCRRAKHMDRLIIATSRDSSDNPIQTLCEKMGLPFYRGSLDDVLDRFYQAVHAHKPDYVVRLTGDCPLIDPEIIDKTIAFGLSGSYDYANNCLQPTFPDGLDVEVMRLSSLETAWREATLGSDREHVTPFLYRHPERFRIGCYKNNVDLSHLRWTVDEPADFALVTEIYKALYPQNPNFGYRDILSLLDQHPELTHMNINLSRNEGYKQSLMKDAIVEKNARAGS